MRKILLILAFAISAMACDKENDDSSNNKGNENLPDTLDIYEFVYLLGHSVSDVKAASKGELKDESNYKGKPILYYEYLNKKGIHYAYFNFDTVGKLENIDISPWGEGDNVYSINLTKKISDRFADMYNDKNYRAAIKKPNQWDKDTTLTFSERKKFWENVTGEDIVYTAEYWQPINIGKDGEISPDKMLVMGYSMTNIISIQLRDPED